MPILQFRLACPLHQQYKAKSIPCIALQTSSSEKQTRHIPTLTQRIAHTPTHKLVRASCPLLPPLRMCLDSTTNTFVR